MKKRYLFFTLVTMLSGTSLFSQQIDTSFGEGGQLPFYYSSAPQSSYVGSNANSNGNTGKGNASVIQPDGKIVTVLRPNINNSDLNMYVYRFLPNGLPDPTFGLDGAVKHFIGTNSIGYDVILQADGKIVLVGETEYCVNGVCGAPQFIMLRLNPNGSLDTSFGVNGHLTTTHVYGATGSYAIPSRLHLLDDGKFIVGGKGPSGRPAILRLNTNGMPDLSFGVNGVYVLSHVPRTSFVDMQVNENGETFTLYKRDTYDATQGGYNPLNYSDFGIFKVTNSGGLDLSFGTNGLTERDLEMTEDPKSLLLTSTNKLLVAGYNISTHGWFNAGSNSGYGLLNRGFVASFLLNGEIDPSIPEGVKSYHFPSDSSTFINKIAEYSPNEYLVCGMTIECPSNGVYKRKGLIMNITENLELNSNFFETGHKVFDVGVPSTSTGASTVAMLNDIDITSDNKILYTGERNPTNALSKLGVYMFRLNYQTEETMSLIDIEDVQRVLVYPNPVIDDNFTVAVDEEMHLNAYTVEGRKIASMVVNKGENIINLEADYKGIIILNFESKDGSKMTKKLVLN